MGTVSKMTLLPGFKHFRGEQIASVVRVSKGKPRAAVQGGSFFFRPRSTQIVEIPRDHQELTFSFPSRSHDFQPIQVTGTITYRIDAVDTIMNRVDFSVSVETGNYREDPLEKLDSVITELAQQGGNAYLTVTDVQVILDGGIENVRAAIAEHCVNDPTLEALGIKVLGVRVTEVKPNSGLEKALQSPIFEQLSKAADKATFDRRSEAVKEERTIADAEQQNQIAAAEKQGLIIEKTQANAMATTQGSIDAARLTSEAQNLARVAQAEAEAAATTLVERAKIDAEKERADIAIETPTEVLWALAGQRLAGHLQKVGNVFISPEVISKLQANSDSED